MRIRAQVRAIGEEVAGKGVAQHMRGHARRSHTGRDGQVLEPPRGHVDERLAHETGMPIRIAHEPLYSVVVGSGRALENIDAMRGLMSLGGDD